MTDKTAVSGVYFLFRKGDLIYVGQSGDCRARIATHRSNGREFDMATFMPLPADQISQIERALIRGFKPPHNKVHVPKPKTPKLEVKPRAPFPNALPERLWPIAASLHRHNTPEIRPDAEGFISFSRARDLACRHGLPHAAVNKAVASGDLSFHATGKFSGTGKTRGEIRRARFADVKMWCEAHSFATAGGRLSPTLLAGGRADG